ncbi:hypothetical protein AAFF_G00076660 [Aldrovandia affinis]|uniref:Uncharacterized protein n=1 Tax=Aldrovandia affinis TaxID=143900 RepID=A0AAD7RY27_9TELE|nr:hypothetical protein AAFF_G00076660 [Aldrovandia affinis]
MGKTKLRSWQKTLCGIYFQCNANTNESQRQWAQNGGGEKEGEDEGEWKRAPSSLRRLRRRSLDASSSPQGDCLGDNLLRSRRVKDGAADIDPGLQRRAFRMVTLPETASAPHPLRMPPPANLCPASGSTADNLSPPGRAETVRSIPLNGEGLLLRAPVSPPTEVECERVL